MARETSIGDRVVPSLLVRQMDESIAFYRTVLGFRMTGRYPDTGEPDWVEVRRDGVVLWFFREAPEGIPDAPSLSGTIYLFPESVDELAGEIAELTDFEWGPEDMHYGLREFAVRDPNGYVLAFAGPVTAGDDPSGAGTATSSGE